MTTEEVDRLTVVGVQVCSPTKNGNGAEEMRVDQGKDMTTASRVIVFGSLQLALFLAALDATIVATSLPTIGSEFNEMTIISWVATAYIVPYNAFQPISAKFSDIFGRKWILLLGIFIFLFGSILCGAATSMGMLIGGRAIAGMGGACILSMIYIIISDLIPVEKRGSYQGLISVVFALASVFGPLIGGSFTQFVTWRWNFYLNLPIGVLATALLLYFLRLPTSKENFRDKLKRIDYAGTILVPIFTTLFLLALNFGGQLFPWKSAAVIAPFVLSGVAVVAFCLVENYAKEPIIPLRLFKIRTVTCILLVNWFFGIAFFAMLYYLPVYFQVIRNDAPMSSGIRLIPMQLVTCVMATIAGVFITKTGHYYSLIWIGSGMLTLCAGLLCLFDSDTSWSTVYGVSVIGGFGIGLNFTTATVILQSNVASFDEAVVTGLGNFSRILGGALGVGIGSAVLNSSLQENLPTVIPPEYASKVMDAPNYIRHGLPTEYIQPAIETYGKALRLVWYVTTALSGITLLLSLFIKRHSVKAALEISRHEGKRDTATTETTQVVLDIEDDVPETTPNGHHVHSTEK